MDAQAAPIERRWPHTANPTGVLGPAATWLLMALLLAAGVLLCVRRLSGALVTPPPAGVLLIVGITLALANLALRRVASTQEVVRPLAIAVWGGPWLLLALVVFGVALPGINGLGLAALVGIVLLVEGWSWGKRSALTAQSSEFPAAVNLVVEPPAAEPTTGAAVMPLPIDEPQVVEPPILEMPDPGVPFRVTIGEEVASDDTAVCGFPGTIDDPPGEACDELVSQQIVRRGPAGEEILEGFTRVHFTTGERVAAAHLSICPPLSRVPACYAEPSDGPDAQVRVTHVYSHGVRLEVKLDHPAEEPTSVLVEFSIQENPEALHAEQG